MSVLRHSNRCAVVSYCDFNFSSVQPFNHIQLFATPWTAACQASLSITNSRSLLKLMSVESVMPSNHLILYRPLLLLPSIVPSIKVFSNELVLRIRWPKYWSFSFSISPSNEYSGLISFRIDWFDGHEFEQGPGAGDGQGSLACCSPRGCKESDMTEWQEPKRVLKTLSTAEECYQFCFLC